MEYLHSSDNLLSNEHTFINSLDENEMIELSITIYELMDNILEDHVLSMHEPSFHVDMIHYFADIFTEEWKNISNTDETNDDDMYHFIEYFVNHYFELRENWDNNIPVRSKKTIANKKPNIDDISNVIDSLRETIQPEQRTPEWYQFRHELITASNLWKVFGTESQYNSLIYEKCLPLVNKEQETSHYVNILSPLHWGQKYEPLSIMIYEKMYQTKIEDFGCIKHESHSFIGASPDGINIDKTNNRYGRMLEIKNIVNREINGIPSKAYWIQMQIQMETCNLDNCDFFETRFKEYENEELFYNETTNIQKGIILHFVERISIGGGFSGTPLNEEDEENMEESNGYLLNQQYSGKPNYVYMPLDHSLEKQDVEEWIEKIRQKMRRSWSLYNVIYWNLNEYSCVLVERNKEWFYHAIPKIKETWDIILRERQTGYEHRSAKKRQKVELQVIQGEENSRIITNLPKTGGICLVKLDNDEKNS